MFEYIKGKLVYADPQKAVIEANGIGYKISIPLSCYSELVNIGNEILLHIAFIVKEDSQTLYGFLQQAERDLFLTLINISGIGPKTAVGILGHLDAVSLQTAVMNDDILQISKVPGIGKKTAQRLLIEMKDKIKNIPLDKNLSTKHSQNSLRDAMGALTHLGYHPVLAQKALKLAVEEYPDEQDTSKLIALALKKI